MCRDGQLGRRSGEWARTKLQFVDEYAPIALHVTRGMHRRWYLDLFAGPGRNIDLRRGGAEFEGSPIRALQLTASTGEPVGFTDAVLVNVTAWEHRALAARVGALCDGGASRIPREHIKLVHGDANVELPAIMSQIPRLDYVFAFVDITGIEHWPFSSVRQLKARGHRSVDLYLLFPLEIALKRHISFDRRMTNRYDDHLNAFFGTDEWERLAERRRTSSDTSRLLHDLTELYKAQLKSVWTYADVQDTIGQSDRKRYYRMFFASNSQVADSIARWQKRRAGRRQISLDLT